MLKKRCAASFPRLVMGVSISVLLLSMILDLVSKDSEDGVMSNFAMPALYTMSFFSRLVAGMESAFGFGDARFSPVLASLTDAELIELEPVFAVQDHFVSPNRAVKDVIGNLDHVYYMIESDPRMKLAFDGEWAQSFDSLSVLLSMRAGGFFIVPPSEMDGFVYVVNQVNRVFGLSLHYETLIDNNHVALYNRKMIDYMSRRLFRGFKMEDPVFRKLASMNMVDADILQGAFLGISREDVANYVASTTFQNTPRTEQCLLTFLPMDLFGDGTMALYEAFSSIKVSFKIHLDGQVYRATMTPLFDNWFGGLMVSALLDSKSFDGTRARIGSRVLSIDGYEGDLSQDMRLSHRQINRIRRSFLTEIQRRIDNGRINTDLSAKDIYRRIKRWHLDAWARYYNANKVVSFREASDGSFLRRCLTDCPELRSADAWIALIRSVLFGHKRGSIAQ